MRVFGYATDKEQDWTAPYPRGVVGMKLRILGGSLVSPDIDSGVFRPGRESEGANWFTVIPKEVRVRFYKKPCKPFVSFGLGRFGFYFGHKVFGMDSPAYLDYPGIVSGDVYPGSRAMTGFTARFTTARHY